jgi:hypothetical protein
MAAHRGTPARVSRAEPASCRCGRSLMARRRTVRRVRLGCSSLSHAAPADVLPGSASASAGYRAADPWRWCRLDGAAGSGNEPYADHGIRWSGLVPGQQGTARVEDGPGDQVISQRLPSGSATNTDRPPQDRSVAPAIGVAPAATAAATSSRVLTVQASVTPDHPVGVGLPGAAAVRSGSGKSARRRHRGESRSRRRHR